MEIKSTLLNENDMRFVRASLEKISEEDNLQDFRVRMLEYINDTAEDEGDTFFFNMMIAIRFMNQPDHIAYTTPQRLIFLNSPGPIGQKIREWEFIYCHECLHQLWETFKVEDDIKKELGSCNHYLMNVASDCVINDYLQFHRGKQGPTDGIYPEVLEKKYGITYNRREDTQYTLYMKLLPKAKELEKDKEIRQVIDLGGQTVEIDVSNSGGGGGGIDTVEQPLTIKNGKIKLKGKQQGGGGGESGKNKPDITYDNVEIDTSELDADACSSEAQTSADSAQTSANIAQQNADAAKNNGDDNADAKQNAADQAQAAADKAKAAADRAKQAAQSGNTDAARKAADEAISAAQEAEDAAKKTMGESGNGDSASSSSKAINDMSADEAAASAQNDADVAKVTAQQLHNAANNVGDSNIDVDDLKKRLDAADQCAANAQKAADEAASAAKSGDDKAAQKAAKVAREQARKALEEVYGAEADTSNPKKLDGKDGKDGKTGTKNNSGQYQATGRNGEGSLDPCMTAIELDELVKALDKEIEKEKNKISSSVAPYIKQCKASKELKKEGLKISVTHGGKSWNADMTHAINAYVKARVAQNKREYEKTYKRPNRRKGVLKPGDIITPGRRIKKNHMIVNVAFYIDRSGSMDSGNAREHAFKAAYKICESLKRQYSRDKFVSKIAFKMYTFDSQITEVPFGQIATSGGTTLPFEDLFKFMADNTSQYLLNIIITDGETGMNEDEVVKYIEQLDGKFIFVCNTHQTQVEKLAKKRPLDVKYIEADSTFSLK